MRNGVLLGLLAVSTAGGGYWLGRWQASLAVTRAVPQAAPAKSQGKSTLPPLHHPPAKKSAAQLSPLPGGHSIEEIKAGFLHLKKEGLIRNGLTDDSEWLRMIADVDVADIPELLAFVDNNLPKTMRSGSLDQLLQRWAESDVSAAMAYAQALPNRQEREQCVSSVAGVWAKTDAAGVVAWLKPFPSGPFRDQLFNSILTAISAADPQGAFELYQSLNCGGLKRGSGDLPTIFGNWAAKDPAAAVAKAAEVLTGSQRSQAFLSIAASWAQQNPKAAMDWADTLANGNDKCNIINSIFSVWSQNDVTGALACAKQLPEGPVSYTHLTLPTNREV